MEEAEIPGAAQAAEIAHIESPMTTSINNYIYSMYVYNIIIHVLYAMYYYHNICLS